MYADPALIRKPYGKVTFNDAEARLVDAYIAYIGEQRQVVYRNIILEHAAETLAASGVNYDGLSSHLKSA